MIINKALEQTIPKVGFTFHNVFSNGQLYVALSRGMSITSPNGNEKLNYTKNIVYN